MHFAEFIEDFLVNLIRTYRDYFKKTYAVALIFAFFIVVGARLLLLLSSPSQIESIESYFFTARIFSYAVTIYQPGVWYEYSDLSIPLFLICTSFFAIGFQRIKDSSQSQFGFRTLLSEINSTDVKNILAATIIIILVDILIYNWNSLSLHLKNLDHYSGNTSSFFRTYIPILVLIWAVSKSLYPGEIKISGKAILFLFIAANIVTWSRYIVAEFIDSHERPLLLITDRRDAKYLVEMVLSVPLIACFILGYTSLFAYPLRDYCQHQISTTVETEMDDEENPENEISQETD